MTRRSHLGRRQAKTARDTNNRVGLFGNHFDFKTAERSRHWILGSRLLFLLVDGFLFIGNEHVGNSFREIVHFLFGQARIWLGMGASGA